MTELGNGVEARIARIDERTASLCSKIDKLFELHENTQRQHSALAGRMTTMEAEQRLLHSHAPTTHPRVAKLVPVGSVVGGAGVAMYVLLRLIELAHEWIKASG